MGGQPAGARPMVMVVPQLVHRACLQLDGHALGKPFNLPTPSQVAQQMQLLEHQDLEQGALQAGRQAASCVVAGAGRCAFRGVRMQQQQQQQQQQQRALASATVAAMSLRLSKRWKSSIESFAVNMSSAFCM